MPPRRGLAGLATLEWLLVIAAAGGFAAAMSVAFQSLLDEAARTPPDPRGALIDAGIDAAAISHEAIGPQTALAGSPDGSTQADARAALAALRRRCENLRSAYPDTVASAAWTWDTTPIETPAPPPATASGTGPAPTTAPRLATTLTTGATTAPDTATTLDPDAAVHASGRWTCRINSPQ